MVQAIINISDEANKVLNIVKAKYELKDKSEAINMVTKLYMEDLMEPELRPEFIDKMFKLKNKKQKSIKFNSIEELRNRYEK